MENIELLNHYKFMQIKLIEAQEEMDFRRVGMINDVLMRLEQQMTEKCIQF